MLEIQNLNSKVLKSQEVGTLDDYRAFEERLFLVLKNYLYKYQFLDILNSKEKHLIYNRLCHISSLQSSHECILSDSLLDKINKEYHKIINEFRFKLEGKKISLLDFKILASFYDVIYHGIKSRKRRRFLKEKFAVPILEGFSLLKLVPKMYTACFSILNDFLNNISSENCSFRILAKKKGLGIELTPIFNIEAESISKEKEFELQVKSNEKQRLSCKTAVKDIYNFKNYNLNIHTMQEANYEEFLSYIKQGEDTNLKIDNSNREELALQSHSIGKLLQLLIINTFGLLVAQVAKISYSLVFKFKNIFKPRRNVKLKTCEKESSEYTASKRLEPNNLKKQAV